MHPQGVLGIFSSLDGACTAIEKLREIGHKNLTVLSPAPHHEIDHAMEQPVSSVKWFTLCGALTGLASAVALQVWTSLDWPLVVNGKPLVSWPAFFIVMFELTVLLAGISTVAGFIILSKLPHTRLRVGYDPRFSDDRIGIWIPCNADRRPEVEQALRGSGAEEVKIEAD